jgi:hypothetical protein
MQMSTIITAEQLKSINPAVNDVVGGLVADAVNAYVENVTSRCWGETKTVTERYDASDIIWLRHMDVKTVDAVKSGYPNQDQTTYEAAHYYCSPEGRLVLRNGYSSRWATHPTDYLEVTYTYGTDDVPADLVLAGLGIAAGYYEYLSNGGREVNRAQVGSYMVQYAAGGGDPTQADTVTRDMKVVNSYALRRV